MTTHDHASHSGDDSHRHEHAHDYRSASRRALVTVLVLLGVYMIVEAVAGILSGSLGLLAHATHMVTDVMSIALALLAMWLAQRPATVNRTFGYLRIEVLIVIINVVALLALASWIFYEAFQRFGGHFTDDGHHVEGWTVLIIACVGLAVNIFSAWILYRSSRHSINVEGAFWHVIADLMGSVAVLISGILLLIFKWHVIDAILSIVIAALIIVTAGRLAVKVFHILVEGVPTDLDVYQLCSAIEDVEGVMIIHDFHVWTITTGYNAMAAHVLIDPEYEKDTEHMAHKLREVIEAKFGIQHITLQVERSAAPCRELHHLGHLEARATSDLG